MFTLVLQSSDEPGNSLSTNQTNQFVFRARVVKIKDLYVGFSVISFTNLETQFMELTFIPVSHAIQDDEKCLPSADNLKKTNKKTTE